MTARKRVSDPVQHVAAERRPADVRTGPLLVIPTLLAEFGVEPSRVLVEAGVDPVLLAGSENRVSFALLGRLLEACVAATGCPYFGLLVGERFEIGSLGVLGQLMRNSPDLRTALRLATLHLELHDRGALSLLLDDGRGVTDLGYSLFAGRTVATEQILDGAMAMHQRLLQTLCGPAWTARTIRLSHKRPPHVTVLRRSFRVPIEFDAKLSAVVFDAKWLAFPIPGADPRMFADVMAAVAAQRPRHEDAFLPEVRRALAAMVLSGYASAASLASLFGMNERTLRRRLADRGTAVRGLIGEVRRELAHHLLRDTALPVSEIAAILGYSDLTVFSRAFRAWTGVNPRQWRMDSPGPGAA